MADQLDAAFNLILQTPLATLQQYGNRELLRNTLSRLTEAWPQDEPSCSRKRSREETQPTELVSKATKLVDELSERISEITLLANHLEMPSTINSVSDDVARLDTTSPKERIAAFAGLRILHADFEVYKFEHPRFGKRFATAPFIEEHYHVGYEQGRKHLRWATKLISLCSPNKHWGFSVFLATVNLGLWSQCETDSPVIRTFFSKHASLFENCGRAFDRYFQRYIYRLMFSNIEGHSVVFRIFTPCKRSEHGCPDQDALKRLSIPNTIVTTTCEMLKNLPAYHDLNFLAANLLKLLFSLGAKGIPDIVLQRGYKPVKRRDKKGGEVLPPSSFDATVEEIFDEIRLDSSISVLKECLDDFSSVWPNGSSRAWSLSDLTEDWLRESAWDKEVWQRWAIKVICHTLLEEEYDLEPLWVFPAQTRLHELT